MARRYVLSGYPAPFGGSSVLDQPQAHDTHVTHHPPLPASPSAKPETSRAQEDTSRLPSPDGAPLAKVVALTRLLVLQEPIVEVLVQALRLGMELAPELDSTTLYVLAADRRADLIEMVVVERTTASTSSLITCPERPVSTLGFGQQIDRQVLDEGQPLRHGRTRCVPLRGAQGTLVGVLTLRTRRPEVARASGDALAVLTDTVTVLAERWRSERHRVLAEAALRSALPHGRAHLTAVPAGAIETEVAELRALLAAVRGLFPASDVLAFLLTESGGLRGLVGRSRTFEIPARQSHQLRTILTRLSHDRRGKAMAPDEVWSVLARVRPHLRLVNAGDKRASLVVLPVRSRDAQVALLLVVMPSPGDERDELGVLLAQVLCDAVGERIRAVQATAAQEAQGHHYDAFLSLMAHELRSPLTSVKGYAQLLMRQARRHALPEQVVRAAEAIEQQSARISEMIDELHDAARIRRNRLELLAAATDLASIVRQQVERWHKLAPEHEYHLILHDDTLVGDWDTQRVTQIVRDLLDNATRYSPSGGPVSIELRRDGEMALLSVRDAGIGISSGEHERIFEYLHRAPEAEDRHLAGLGLGLFVSRGIAERLGGHLWLQETRTGPDSGSEFRLALPLRNTLVA
jgi:signal transduction histidine kinase